ncbi:MAG: hypothetical protein FWG66_08335 [Spirochaetes bacterium]|nr:hypothetical protein [Spirochaetota bacterium]
MRYIVTKAHASDFPIPMELAKGEKVTLAEDPYSVKSPGWENWEYCIKADASGGGFVPGQILSKRKNGLATVLEDYTAKELTAEKGTLLCGTKEMNGWLWAKREDTGELGWIPLENIARQTAAD